MIDPDDPSTSSHGVDPLPPRDAVGDGERPDSASWPADEVVRRFVAHWGEMARSWGINTTMGQLFALLYITATDWTAEDLRVRLKVSRGNVSMNLRELIAWGVVRKVDRPDGRREHYRAETEIWTLFRRIAEQRKRRELDPTLALLAELDDRAGRDADLAPIRDRVADLREFFALVDALADRFSRTDRQILQELRAILAVPSPDPAGDDQEIP